jgi:acid phosphatase
VDDPLWKSTFEDIYSGEFWENLVFFPSLGNHDVRGSAQAQIDYSEQSSRWTMPAEYYSFQKPLPSGGSVRFLALETNAIKPVGSPDAASQLEWVDSVLGSSSDRWVIAYGHHPMESAGWHDVDKHIRERLETTFRGRVPLYLAGHNHSTELLRVSDGLFQAVCGGGAGRDNAYRVGTNQQTLSAFSNGGWCLLHVWSDVMAVELYNRAGTLRFRHLIYPTPPSG